MYIFFHTWLPRSSHGQLFWKDLNRSPGNSIFSPLLAASCKNCCCHVRKGTGSASEVVSEGGTGTWLRVFIANLGVKYQCSLWHHRGWFPDGILLILLLKRNKKTATVQWPVEFLACIGKINFTFNGKQPLTRLTFPILRVSFRMNLVPGVKFTLTVFNMKLYITYFYLYGQFASLLRACTGNVWIRLKLKWF